MTLPLRSRAGRRQDSIVAPLAVEPVQKAVPREAGNVRPLSNAGGFTVESQIGGVGLPSVSQLLFGSGPSAVVFIVRAVVVSAIYRSAVWALTHVFVERLECSPAFADRDAASTVVRKLLMFRIQASLAHRRPRGILRSVPVVPRVTVRGRSGAAPATDGLSAQQRVRIAQICTAAITRAEPDDDPVPPFICWPDRSEQSEALSGDVFCSRPPYSIWSQAVSSFTGDGAVRGWWALVTSASLASNYPTSQVPA